MFPAARKKRVDLEEGHPWIRQLKDSLRDMISYDDLSTKALIRWMKKLESSMSVEAAKLRNKPNRATRVAAVLRRLMANFKLLTCQLKNDEILKLYPTFSLITSYYLNLVFKSTISNKRTNEKLATDIYSFVKLMLYEFPEYILDAILSSTIGDKCATTDSFEHMVLKLVIFDKFLFDKDSSSFLKYLCVVTLIFESGGSIDAFQEVIKRYKHVPKDFNLYLKSELKLKLKTDEYLDLSLLVKRMHSRQIVPICKNRLYVVSVDNLDLEDDSDCDSDDTVSMVGDYDAGVSSTNPDLDVSVSVQVDSDEDSDEDSFLDLRDANHLHRSEPDVTIESDDDSVMHLDEDTNTNFFHQSTDGDEDVEEICFNNTDDNFVQENFPQITSVPTAGFTTGSALEEDSDEDLQIIDEVHVSEGDTFFTLEDDFKGGSNIRDEADPSSDEAEQYVPVYTSEEDVEAAQDIPSEPVSPKCTNLVVTHYVNGDALISDDESTVIDNTIKFIVAQTSKPNFEDVEVELSQPTERENVSPTSKKDPAASATPSRASSEECTTPAQTDSQKGRSRSKRRRVDPSTEPRVTRSRTLSASKAETPKNEKMKTRGTRRSLGLDTPSTPGNRRSPRTPQTKTPDKNSKKSTPKSNARANRK